MSNAALNPRIAVGTCGHGTPLSWHCYQCEVDTIGEKHGRVSRIILKMISIRDRGYAVCNGNSEVILELDVESGQPIFRHPLNDPKLPEVASIFLHGVVAGRQPSVSAQGIAARSDETPVQAAQPEGQEPGPKDAPEQSGGVP